MKKIRINISWWLRQLYQYLFYKIEWYISDERKDPYRCCECGSSNVEHKAWIKVNEGGRYVEDCDESNSGYCNNCGQHVRTRTTSYILSDVNKWWDKADLATMERVTELRQCDFIAENGSQKFTDACTRRWEKLPVDRKIDIWRELQFWQEQEFE